MKKFSVVAAVILSCFLGSVVANLMIQPQIAMGAAASPGIIRASCFELIDNSGTKRASLEMENEDKTAALYLWDSNGKPLVALKASPDGSSLLMKFKDKPVAGIAVEKDKGVMAFANDPKTGKPGISTSVNEAGGIILIYEDGKPRAVGAAK